MRGNTWQYEVNIGRNAFWIIGILPPRASAPIGVSLSKSEEIDLHLFQDLCP
jgi:hypothetical protein